MVVTEIIKQFRVVVKITDRQHVRFSESDFDFESFGWRDPWPDYELFSDRIVFPIMDDEREAERLEATVLGIIAEEDTDFSLQAYF
jgi:hypothetical protein